MSDVYDDAYDRALDAGLCVEAAADYAYDAWRGSAPPPVQYPPREAVEAAYEQGYEPADLGLVPRRVSSEYLEREYGGRCRR